MKVWLNTFHQIDLKDTVIKIKDGGSNSIEVKIGEGNLSWTERRNMQYTLDRGRLDLVREGDQVPVEVSLDFVWEYITGAGSTGGTPTVEDAVKRLGAAENWESTDDDACQPYAVDIEIANVPSPSGCGDSETITLADFRWEEVGHTLREGTVSMTGRCNVTTASVSRA